MNSQEDKYRGLLRQITIDKGKPLDRWEISALLESFGIRDIDAKNEWGFENVFGLAEKLLEYVDEFKYEIKDPELETKALIRRVIVNYLKGMLFAVPMAIQILSMVIVGVGIWSYIHFTLREATAIAIGTLLALTTTGGISQVIGRKGLFYLKFEEYLLASKITKRLYLMGIVLIFIFAVLMYLINAFMNIFPEYMIKIAIYYYVLLGIIFLVFSVFYVFEDYLTISLIVLLGVVLVYVLFKFAHLNIYISQWIAMVILVIVSNITAFIKLRKTELESYAEGVALPKVSTLFYTLYPFFIYGILYFIFLSLDRFLAWTTSKNFLPYPMWFNMPYEVGVDWALLTFIATIALIEVFIYELGIMSFRKIKSIKAHDVNKFNSHFLSVYKVSLVSFFVIGIISILISYFVPFVIFTHFNFPHAEMFFILINQKVFWFASIGYAFLSMALLNCIIFFSYSRYELAIKSIALGVLTNLIVGFAFSRIFEYYYAIVGLTAGAIVFMLISTYWAFMFFKNFHYYYYSAY
jgi:hypothetical protein